jgi:hypothetical protein
MPSPDPGAPRRAGRCRLLVFDGPHPTLAAVRGLRAAGFDVEEVHSPFPVHGVDEAMGLRETRLPWATLAGGASGLALGLGFESWTHTRSWPLDIGGKPNLSLPALVPVAFELTVLVAAFFTVGALVAGGLAIRRASRRAPVTAQGVTDDRFVVLVSEPEPGEAGRFREVCAGLAPVAELEWSEP